MARSLDEVCVNDIIETIEGPYALNRCQFEESVCTRTGDKNCPYHDLFTEISLEVRQRLSNAKLSDMVLQQPMAKAE